MSRGDGLARLREALDGSGQARVFACVKSNLAAEPPAFAYRLVPDGLHGCARVQWEGISDHRAASLLTEPAGDEERDDRTERNEAAEWLTGYLTDNDGEATPGDAKKAARGGDSHPHTRTRPG